MPDFKRTTLRFICRLLPFVCVLLAISGSRVLALDPAQPTSSYLQTTFTMSDGLPSNVVNAIVQSQTGFLWVGTDAGLARFNGRRFNRINLRGAISSPQGVVRALALSPVGDLWVGTDTGLVRIPSATLDEFDAARISFYHPGPDLSDEITCLQFSRDGSLWVGTNRGLYRFDGRKFETAVPEVSISRLESAAAGHMLAVSNRGWLELDGLKTIEHPGVNARMGVGFNEVFHVMQDHSGDFWFCNGKGLARQHGNSIERFQPYGTKGSTAWRIIQDPQDNLWVFTQTGLFRVNANGLEPLATGMTAASVFCDRDGNLWVGRKGDGLVRFKNRSVHLLKVIPGPVNTRPMTVLSASDGRLWVGNSCGGVSVFDGGDFKNYNEKDGLISPCVWALAEDAQKDLWIGTYGGGVFRLRDGVFKQFSKREGLPGIAVRAMLFAPDGSLWIGTEEGLSLMRDGKFHTYTTSDGLASNRVLNIYRDRKGRVWIATNRGIDRMVGEHFIHVPSIPEVVDGQYIGLNEDSSGALYATSAPKGISLMKEDRVTAINDDLEVLSMLEYRSGDVWLAGKTGFFRFPAGEIGRRPDSREGALDFEQFGIADGLLAPQGEMGVPNMAVTPDEKLWVATAHGLAMIDLARLPKSNGRPVIYADEVTVGRNRAPAGRELTLPPGIHHVELHFDSLELTSPEKIRFQYRLDGVDSNWLDADSSRTAVYTSMPVGRHAFHIRATNANGIWDRTGVIYNVTQNPYFYETAAFRMSAVVVTALGLIFLYRLRMRVLTREIQGRLQERVSERERIARDLHDTLLQSFHGLMLRFQAVQNMLPAQPMKARDALEKAIARAAEAVAEGRDAVQELRGSRATSNDLVESLTSLGPELRANHASTEDKGPPSFGVVVEGAPRPIYSILRDDIYRIAREAVGNAFRHARADRIEVELRYDERILRLRVRDDGIGIDPQLLIEGGRHGHWGLPGMKERAKSVGGSLEIESGTRQGTEIELTIPGSIAYTETERRTQGTTKKSRPV